LTSKDSEKGALWPAFFDFLRVPYQQIVTQEPKFVGRWRFINR